MYVYKANVNGLYIYLINRCQFLNSEKWALTAQCSLKNSFMLDSQSIKKSRGMKKNKKLGYDNSSAFYVKRGY